MYWGLYKLFSKGGRFKPINLNMSGISHSNSYLFYGSILSLEQCCETAPQFFMAYGELWLSFLWLTAESLKSAKKP